MKRKLIALCISSLLVGSGIVFTMNQDVSIPTVEKFTEDTSTSVSKHEAIVSEPENVDKDEKTSTRNTIKKTEFKEEKQKEKVTGKSESKTTSVSSEGKTQNSKKESSTKSSSSSDQKGSTSNSSNISDKSNNDVVSQPVEKPSESKRDPVVEPTPAPELARPGYACPGGVNPDVSCDVILDTNFYFEIYGSQSEADAAGMYYLDEVMYIGEIEITNYSVQPVYRNDHSIAYYGLNLWSNGNLVQ